MLLALDRLATTWRERQFASMVASARAECKRALLTWVECQALQLAEIQHMATAEQSAPLPGNYTQRKQQPRSAQAPILTLTGETISTKAGCPHVWAKSFSLGVRRTDSNVQQRGHGGPLE